MSSDTVFKAHPPGKTLWRATLDFKGMLTADKAEIFSDCLEDTALSVLLRNEEASDGDNWMIDLVCEQEPDTENILFRLHTMAEAQDWALSLAKPDIRLEALPDKDWLSHVHEAFPPLDIGRFFVYGSHYQGDIPNGKDGLLIDAATAFGSGEHGTTSGCLQALEALSQTYDVKSGLDMGCGSGILAIGMAKLWPQATITAVDIDPESVRVTQNHAQLNHISDTQIPAAAGDGYKTPIVTDNGPYDLIVANILANPLVDMAPDLFHHLKKGGYAVLSGLLVRQKEMVLDAHKQAGLEWIDGYVVGDWQTLVLKKP